MASTLLLPGGSAPSNLHLAEGVTARFVDSDMYSICDRLAELSPRLHVEELVDTATDSHSYSIMEECGDGVSRLVFKTKELDARVVDKARYIMNVPFEQRFAEAERIEQENTAYQHEQEMERLYEQVGRPMLTQLAKDNFIDRSVSYPIVNPKRKA